MSDNQIQRTVEKVIIQFPDGTVEEALISIPIEQVQTLEEKIIWNDFPND